MQVNQVYDLMNQTTSEVLGKTDIINEDLSNVVDVGTEIQDSHNLDNYVKSLVDHIGKVIFVNRPYAGSAPKTMVDGWEYGSILEKITVDTLPEAEENEEWELQNGASYDPNIFYKPEVSAKFFNKRTTFQIPISFTKKQVIESFSNAEQLNGFMSMIYNSVDRSMTIKTDKLIMETITNMIGETIHADYTEGAGSYSTKSGAKAVNLLYLYNQRFDTQLTKKQALTTPEFNRFAAYIMGLYKSRLGRVSTLFNIGGKDRFTTPDFLHVVLLADFAASAKAYLQSDTYHDEFVRLPDAEVVPSWQGSGLDYSFESTSKIDIKTASNDTIQLDGVLGVMFDRDALGVCNIDREVTTQFNPKANFWSNWYHATEGHWNDFNENFIVFFIQ